MTIPTRPADLRAQTPETCRLTVTGMDCADCAKTIEASLATMPGVQSARVNFGGGTATVTYHPAETDVSAVTRRIDALGYLAAVPHPPERRWLYDVAGMDCSDCAQTIEQGLRRLPTIGDAQVSFGSGVLTVTPAGDGLTDAVVVDAVHQAGYRATPRGERTVTTAGTPVHAWWRQSRVIETVVAVLLWGLGFGLEHAGADRVFSAIPFLFAMVLAGYPVARAAWFAVKARRADMNLLMTIAAIGAIAIGRFDEGSSVLILFATGLMLQTLTVQRTRRAIQALVALVPAEALVLRHGEERRVPVAEVAIGETVLVRPSERIPVDGLVVQGHSAVDQSSITGESISVEVEPDSTVFASSINGDGSLQVRSTKLAQDTTLANIVHLVEEAQSSKAPAQAFVDRFAAIYTPIVIVIALLLATVVPLVLGDFQDWLFKALILLVVACPCALVISTPVALVAAIGSASRRGVLFKGGAAIEALAAVRTVAFDKTGTLTQGRPAVSAITVTGTLDEDEVLVRAAAVERHSTHPIARAVVAEAARRGLPLMEVRDAQGIPGRGARAEIGTDHVLVGSRRLFATLPDDVEQLLLASEQTGQTAVLVGTGRGIEGVITVADPLREQSAGVVRALEHLGVRTVMLTGDNRFAAERIGGQVGVSDVRAELLPEDKVSAVSALQQLAPVAMIGDGVNDAPALATASVGIAMGVAGSDAAIEAADVALMGDDLAQLPVAIRLARRTLAIIHQNIAASLLVKVVFLGLTFAGVTNLWLAVLADTGMALVVTFNSLRLLRPEGHHPRLDLSQARTLQDRVTGRAARLPSARPVEPPVGSGRTTASSSIE